jgi:medium-chain acyl-[acyl-carrier-protein] hydrolase
MNRLRKVNTWIPYRRLSGFHRFRLFCFPYAGGSAAVFRDWLRLFPVDIDICPIQYPGRERRIGEPPFTSIKALVDELAGVLMPECNIPFAFFGHSLGALISFELARKLQKNHLSPEHLFVSGYRAPVIPKRKMPMHVLPDDEFVDRLREYNGTPEEILQNSELMKVLLPTLRADFALHETYIYSSGAALQCPISAFGGINDPEVSYNDLELWQEQTAKGFKTRMLPGDHFYIHHNGPMLAHLIAKDLAAFPKEHFGEWEYKTGESS